MPIIGLDQVSGDSLDIAGGKGANLGELLNQAFPVPPGFIVSADVYGTFIDSLNIPANTRFPDDTSSYIADLRQQIMDAPLEGSISEAIKARHQEIQALRSEDVVYAVRSSATAEDLADASFAGQHDTYYYVIPEAITLMVRKCWASLWSDEAFSYRESQGIEHRDVKMAVVIQEMVRSEVSGVTFTVDPVSGSDSVIITEASWGMGAAIVDGRVSPDQYIVDKASKRLTSLKISDKKFMVPPVLENEHQSRLIEVPSDKRRAECLTDDQAEAVAALAARAEAHFGSPQDIEWAIQDDQLYMLQSRPVTVAGGADTEDLPEGRYILFKPLVENFTDPLMPLTQDVFNDFLPMMEIIYGRVYVKFDFIRRLIPLKLSEGDVARLAYLTEPEVEKPTVSIPRMLALLFVLFGNYLVMGVFNRRTANMPDDFMSSFRQYAQKVVENDRISAPNTVISLFLKYRFLEPAGNMVLLVNLVAPRYMLFLRVLSGLLNRWAPDLPPDAASLLCSGNEGVLSTDMGRAILEMAKIAREDDFVSLTLREKPAAIAIDILRSDSRGENFTKALDAFLDMHGHRALKEFELSSVRWEEDPSHVLAMVRNYLTTDSDLDAMQKTAEDQRKRILVDLESQLASKPLEKLLGFRLRTVQKLIDQIRYYMKLRENSRFYHIMAFYAVRKKILKIESDLLDRGELKCKDDIFYLKWSEVENLRRGHLAWRDVEDLIRVRRMDHIRLSKMKPPKTIGITIDTDTGSDTSGLKGQGASPGQYEGIARVIMDPATNTELEPGEILIAPYTDPAWTPLFLTAHAAVVEVGSYLSHAGTIAREYGMPCVVDVTDCTSEIQTGNRILVDGTAGIVKVLENEARE